VKNEMDILIGVFNVEVPFPVNIRGKKWSTEPFLNVYIWVMMLK